MCNWLFGIMPRGVLLLGLVLFIAACVQKPPANVKVEIGAFPTEVRDLLGQPERTQVFSLPETPFSGPQEGLANLIPAGTLVEEWVYVLDEEELYIWFAGESGQEKDLWPVISTARYPVDAVF